MQQYKAAGREPRLLPKLADAGGAVALGQLGLVGRQDETHVPKSRGRKAQALVDEHLPKRVWQMLFCPAGTNVSHEQV